VGGCLLVVFGLIRMASLFLTAEEVIELTGYRYPSKQIEWLRQWGIRHFVAKDGHPRVLRSALEGKNPEIRRDRPRLEGLTRIK
jgi:hypothetical protein